MQFLIFLCIGGGAALVVWSFMQSRPSSLPIRLPKAEVLAQPKKPLRILSVIFPFTRLALEKAKLAGKLQMKLDAARIRISEAEFLNFKIIFMVGLGAASFFVFSRYQTLPLLIGIALGYILPDLWLNRKITGRKHEIRRLLPETVDLLGLCVEAGLDFTNSLKWIIENKVFTNALMQELEFVLEEIMWGKARTQALKDMSKRLNIPEVSSFVRTLVQAEKMGTPIVEAFAVISEDSRQQRFREGERFALKAPLKILIPLIFCILPVIAIIVGGPIYLRFSQGGLFK